MLLVALRASKNEITKGTLSRIKLTPKERSLR